MGRTGKLKKKSTSLNSRAARRETSPSADVDKSLRSMPRIEASSKSPAIHAVHASAGISKKKSKTKAISRAQRLRQQKNIERAEAVLDQLENKVAKSAGRAKIVKARSAQWEDLNSKNNIATKILQQAEDSDDEQVDLQQSSEGATNANRSVFAQPGDSIPPAEHGTIDEDDEIT
ncbi:Alb1-domain-containing protein [Talaromyces proteolyticus]|uniref:Alb1-domain-containing protein n=1 Tax=Talaromyces proteolyticus TaxID=1131652 RepID=A0AAD4L1E5_9EURO|nr:Alb1-domain-containing protein [Talaromyces proteolyticus]KAH8705359.1 Alb1-domain-containing protein [Talaromyces proteolyticus]